MNSLSNHQQEFLIDLIGTWKEASLATLDEVVLEGASPEKIKEQKSEAKRFKNLKDKLLSGRYFNNSEKEQLTSLLSFALIQAMCEIENVGAEKAKLKLRDQQEALPAGDEIFKIARNLSIEDAVLEQAKRLVSD